jgi:hypothetical protein
MRPTATFMTLATLASVALLGGCSDQKSGNPVPTSAPSSTGLPSDGAPSVADPIANTATVETDPCSAIPATEIKTIGGKVERSELEQMTMGQSSCAATP